MPDAKPVLYHHPFSRSSTAVWMLEEVGRPYELAYVDLAGGEQRGERLRALNPIGKIPILVDGDVIVTESAAIGLYLADRYALGTLAPRPDEPARASYLRWSFFAPSVIEPGAMAKARAWDFAPAQAGWGDWDSMLTTIEHAIGDGPWLLDDRFTMADVILGATLRFLLRFEMLDPRPAFVSYVERLSARPACQAADARNAAIVEERGLRPR